MTLSSKVNSPHTIYFRALCGATVVKLHPKFRRNETLEVRRVVTSASRIQRKTRTRWCARAHERKCVRERVSARERERDRARVTEREGEA